MAVASSAPTPSTSRNCPARAASTCSGVPKTASNLRKRTGPTPGTILSAMLASVKFMGRKLGRSRPFVKSAPSLRRHENRRTEVRRVGHALPVHFERLGCRVHVQVAVATIRILPAFVPVDAGLDVWILRALEQAKG